MREFKLLIGGDLQDGASTLEVLNPATEQVLAICPRADEAQLEAAIAAAKEAFPKWSALPIEERAGKLQKLADALERHEDELVALLTAEQGKPLREAQFEILGGAAILRGFADMRIPLKTIRENDRERIVEQRMALGVVAAILPWNVPIFLLMMKFAPAMLAGNTMIIKPAPTTPLTTLRIGEICASLFPPGVANFIVDNNDLGQAICAHPDVAKVAFTGSTATGRAVMKTASGTLKRLTLELGGNDASIVLDDMSPKDAAGRVFEAAMMNAGQICLAPKRVFVPEEMYEEFCDELAELARTAQVGVGTDPRTVIGPLQNKAQYDKVNAYIAEAKKSGRVIAGGDALPGPGYFVSPTIVCDIDDDARLVREEQFGPVVPVLSYASLDEVVQRANDTEYGLGGTIWTRDPERGYELSLRLVTGTVWVNKYLDLPIDVKVGGAKQSGIGAELGEEGLWEYTQAKIINVALV